MTRIEKAQRDTERRRQGRRIRRRRTLLNMTQGALARALGVSFQMIQKYEAGITRVPAGRLEELCRHLDVAPDYFSSHSGVASDRADALDDFLASADGVALTRAMAGLEDPGTRARLVMAVAAFCDSQNKPEDTANADALTLWLKQTTLPGGKQKETAQTAIRALKVEVARLVGGTLKARALTQSFAAQVLRTDQARISALARGQVEGSSLEKLLRFLLLLGWDAELSLVRRPLGRSGKLKIRAD
jgi:transcriptional regulator with XRE-family HTH domain